jgi:hypothetical protein
MQVRRTGGNVSLNGNKVYYVIVKNWICSLYWKLLGLLDAWSERGHLTISGCILQDWVLS